ncbi:MAG: DUF6017 domain-containing protein [Lachnospiraceae bacterium]
MPIEVVKAQMMKVNRTHKQYVVSALSDTQGQIRNIKTYMLTCLYNAPNTLRWFQQVNSEIKVGVTISILRIKRLRADFTILMSENMIIKRRSDY